MMQPHQPLAQQPQSTAIVCALAAARFLIANGFTSCVPIKFVI
jgi:hypothetical protein